MRRESTMDPALAVASGAASAVAKQLPATQAQLVRLAERRAAAEQRLTSLHTQQDRATNETPLVESRVQLVHLTEQRSAAEQQVRTLAAQVEHGKKDASDTEIRLVEARKWLPHGSRPRPWPVGSDPLQGRPLLDGGGMRCAKCGSEAVSERRERTAQGYHSFRCHTCSRTDDDLRDFLRPSPVTTAMSPTAGPVACCVEMAWAVRLRSGEVGRG